jgi:hypothetical protein
LKPFVGFAEEGRTPEKSGGVFQRVRIHARNITPDVKNKTPVGLQK